MHAAERENLVMLPRGDAFDSDIPHVFKELERRAPLFPLLTRTDRRVKADEIPSNTSLLHVAFPKKVEVAQHKERERERNTIICCRVSKNHTRQLPARCLFTRADCSIATDINLFNLKAAHRSQDL